MKTTRETMKAPEAGYRTYLFAAYLAPTPDEAAEWFRDLLGSDDPLDFVHAVVVDSLGRAMEYQLHPAEHGGKQRLAVRPWVNRLFDNQTSSVQFFEAIGVIDSLPEDDVKDPYDAAVMALADLRDCMIEVVVWWRLTRQQPERMMVSVESKTTRWMDQLAGLLRKANQ